MKAAVIREMSLVEIQERIDNEKSAYQKLKMNHVVSSLENPLKLKYARKTIARLSTELTKRAGEAAGETSQATPANDKDTEENHPKEETQQEGSTVETE